MRSLLFALSLVVCVPLFSYPSIPDNHKTPGELCTDDDADFTEYRYDEEIPYCERNVSTALKSEIYDSYRIPKSERKSYTIDHLIPLSIGGDNSRLNLWPEHKKLKATRPALEMDVYVALRDGKVTQDEAVHWILREKLKARKQFEASRP